MKSKKVNELISPIVKKKYVYFLIHILLPILLGGFIYILLRSSSLLMFQWFESIGILEIVLSFRNISIGLKTSVPSWFYYSLPDGLWVYSFTTAILLFGNDFKNIKLITPDLNLGYGKANNLGVNKSKTTYILIVNPDILLNEQLINTLYSEFLNYNDDIGVIGPSLYDSNIKYRFSLSFGEISFKFA